VHNSTRHSARECREIRKLVEQFREKQQQLCQEGAPSRQREGKQKMDPEEEKDEEMKSVYGHSDSESSYNERRKTLHVMFGDSWDITSQRVVKTTP
jgi:hypothetical protein